jgi:uncharacterized protein with GYD domain
MARYLLEASYSPEGLTGLLKEGGTARRAAVAELVESVGGRLEAYYHAFGPDDVYVIVDYPSNVAAASASMTVAASGAATVKTVVLLTPDEIDEATKMTPTYRTPGTVLEMG